MDIFDQILDSETQRYKDAYQKGLNDAQERIEKESIEEGHKFGKQVGNEIAYYKKCLELMKKWKPDLFGTKKYVQYIYALFKKNKF